MMPELTIQEFLLLKKTDFWFIDKKKNFHKYNYVRLTLIWENGSNREALDIAEKSTHYAILQVFLLLFICIKNDISQEVFSMCLKYLLASFNRSLYFSYGKKNLSVKV